MAINFDLNDLFAFRAVAELSNFRKAAESVHLSQPAFSRRIDKLEQALGVRLLERTTRRVTLTAVGRDFERKVRELLDELDNTLLGIRGVAAIWVVLYHRNSLYYRVTLFLFDHIVYRGYRRRTFRERLSMIEHTTSAERPLVNVYSRREVRTLLAEAGFEVASVWVRKLVIEDLPDVPLLGRLWKYIPRRWLDGAGRWFGWYIIARGRKR